ITATADPAGRIRYRMPPYREMAGQVTYRFESGLTPYTRYGDWFAWSCLIAGIACALFPSRGTREKMRTQNLRK
ncbi:MAG TPA: hypothetical protein VKX39_01615, partial [Bryobacteraceae bacterium]|nr:hypothetical protein [Bryobacteraceae bacterium]